MAKSYGTTNKVEPTVPKPAAKKQPVTIAVGEKVELDGKSGKILWVGTKDEKESVKVLWDEGGVHFFFSSELA